MKTKAFVIIFLIAILGLASPWVALAQTPEMMPQMETPEPITTGNVTYVSGGIGSDEAQSMRAIAKNYPLEIVFVQRYGQQEEFLAEVNVQIKGYHQDVILDIKTEGPYLLAKLPQGKYRVVAEHNGVVKQQWVQIQGNKHQKLVFWWPVLDSEIADMQ